MSYFELLDICKTYIGGYPALNYASMAMDKGQTLALVGIKKSGKTSLMQVIAGLESVDSGNICIDGKDIVTLPMKSRNIGYLPEELPLFEHKKVMDNILYPIKIRKIATKDYIEKYNDILYICELDSLVNTKCKDLSLVERIQVSLARLFLLERDVYLVDNIFELVSDADLDKIINIVTRLAKYNTVICAVSDMAMARRVNAQRVALMAYDTVTECGDIDKAMSFDSTVASVKYVLGECSELEFCILPDGKIDILGRVVDNVKDLFQPVFEYGEWIVPKGELVISQYGEYGGEIDYILRNMICISYKDTQCRIYVDNPEQYAVGDKVSFDFDYTRYAIYDRGSERKISI